MKIKAVQKQSATLRRVMIMISGSVAILSLGLVLLISLSAHTKSCAVQASFQHKMVSR